MGDLSAGDTRLDARLTARRSHSWIQSVRSARRASARPNRPMEPEREPVERGANSETTVRLLCTFKRPLARRGISTGEPIGAAQLRGSGGVKQSADVAIPARVYSNAPRMVTPTDGSAWREGRHEFDAGSRNSINDPSHAFWGRRRRDHESDRRELNALTIVENVDQRCRVARGEWTPRAPLGGGSALSRLDDGE